MEYGHPNSPCLNCLSLQFSDSYQCIPWAVKWIPEHPRRKSYEYLVRWRANLTSTPPISTPAPSYPSYHPFLHSHHSTRTHHFTLLDDEWRSLILPSHSHPQPPTTYSHIPTTPPVFTTLPCFMTSGRDPFQRLNPTPTYLTILSTPSNYIILRYPNHVPKAIDNIPK